MNHEDIMQTKQFQEILQKIPEEERAKVIDGIKQMIKDFNSKVLLPLETITKK